VRRRRDDEFYVFWGRQINVTALREYAEAYPLPVVTASVASIANMMGFDCAENESARMSVFRMDVRHALSLPEDVLVQPGLILRFGSSTLLVDGTHRAYRLWRMGVESMRVYCIDDREAIQRQSNLPDVLWSEGD
jgi:hypothetical protein